MSLIQSFSNAFISTSKHDPLYLYISLIQSASNAFISTSKHIPLFLYISPIQPARNAFIATSKTHYTLSIHVTDTVC